MTRSLLPASYNRIMLMFVLVCVAMSTLMAEQVPITYTLPKDARVSLLLTNAAGTVVRELLHAAARTKGTQTEQWDGLDEQGKPVPAGNYTWKLLSTQGLHAEYLLTVGTNPKPMWAGWPGNHNGVNAVAVDASGEYIGGAGEGTVLIVKQAVDETRLWSIDHWLEAWQGAFSMGVSNGKVFMLQGNGKVQVLDAASGKVGPRWDIRWLAEGDTENTNFGEIMDLDAAGEQFVVSYRKQNAVRWLDQADGKVIDVAAVPQPKSVAIDPRTGRILIISDNTVLALTREAKTPQVIITKGLLQGAHRISVDPTNSDILVAESDLSGEASGQQVKRFSAAGKLLAAYGKRGGRPVQGAYDPNGFCNINDIAVRPDGGFLICESFSPPRRTARFSRTGKLLREWYGGQMYANYAAPDPEDPTHVWIESHWGSLIHAKVDYKKRTWKVLENYYYTDLGGLVPGKSHGGGFYVPRHYKNRTYLCRVDGYPIVLQVDARNRRLIPKAAAGNIPWNDGSLKVVKDAAGDKRPWFYTWADLNDDNQVSADEVSFPTGVPSNACYPREDFSYAVLNDVPQMVSVARWTKGGTPIYDWEHVRVNQPLPADIVVPDGRGVGRVGADEVGNTFGCYNTTLNNKRFGQGWWGAVCGGNRVAKWDAAGKLQWIVGRHAAGRTPSPGEAKFFWRITGTANGCVVVSDVEAPMHVWDKDGLWVGRLLEYPNTKAAPLEAYTMGSENFGGALYTVPAGTRTPGLNAGDLLFIGSGQNNNHIYRITGWDQFYRLQGAVAITPSVATTIAQEYEAQKQRLLQIPYMTPGYTTIGVDGDLTEWKNVKPLEIRDGDTVRAKAYVGWGMVVPSHNGSHGLCAAFDVTTTTPWKSAGTLQNGSEGGASVEIRFGPADGSAGFSRIVVAPIGADGKPVAIEYLPTLPTGWRMDQLRPVTFTSAKGTLTYERAAELPANWVAVKPKADGSGYTVEVLIPMRSPLDIAPGMRLRVDAVVTLANAEGTQSVFRMPAHSADPADRVVDDPFTAATLRPQFWMDAVIE